MSLNTIELPKKILVDLYKDSLVELEAPASVIKDNKLQTQWKFLGENKKKVLIIVNYTDVVNIPDKELGFLTKLLSACKLNLGDVAVLNFQHHSKKDFSGIISHFNAKTIFLFGVGPDEFGMPLIFPHFQVQVFKDATFLYSPALNEIESDKVLKSKLWVCFKKIFGL